MIYILGAFERFNYGDLLFPKILYFALESANINIPVTLLGLIDADLTGNGGDKVESLSKYINQFVPSDVLIVAGGQVIGKTISDLYFYLKKASILSFFCRVEHKIRLTDFTNLFLKSLLKLNLKYPYLLNGKELGCTVIYNAVGGQLLCKDVFELAQNASYFSTRSSSLYNDIVLNAHKSNKSHILLYPDSVEVMSDYYKMSLIKDKVLDKNIEVLESYGYSYITFQVNKAYYNRNKSIVLEQLVELYNKIQLPIVLVPIGLALRHEDDIACEQIKSFLSIPLCVINSKTIYDIMYAIANSKIFIGTSLHGNITAMSYDVPHVGFGGPKLDGYLKKWAWGLQKAGCITPDIISIFAIKVLEQNLDDYKEANMHRRELARENLKNIMEIIKSSFCEC